MRVLFALIALAFVFIAPPVFGGAGKLTGVWTSGDSAHEAAIGFLRIIPRYIYFSEDGQNWQCKTGYKIVTTGSGNEYPDQLDIFRNIVKTRTWEYVKIHLDKSECTQYLLFLFAFASDIDNYADFVEYDKESKPNGWGHFYKIYELETNDLTIDQAAPTRKRDVWLRSCSADADGHEYHGTERKSFLEKCLGTHLRAPQSQWRQCLDTKRESDGLAYTEYLETCLNK